MPPVFEEKGITYGNSWRKEEEIYGVEGDCSKWLDHFDKLGWGDNKKHMLQWMAFTILHPETKINHMLLLGGHEGCGKDYLLTPLIEAMGEYSHTIDGNDLLSGFNEYLLGTKYLHINETELGDHRQAQEVSNKLKPLAAAPPTTLMVNDKFVSRFKIRNIVNLSMTTNSKSPVKLNGTSRRFYAIWSNLIIRNQYDEVTAEWEEYWEDRINWMNNGGVQHCIYYLRNHVDLSDFSPGSAPPMTDFLRDIKEDSKSPMQQTVEAFITEKIGVFEYDLISSQDASATLRTGSIDAEEFTYSKAEWFTPVAVGKQLTNINGCMNLRMKGDEGESRVWAIRNKDTYDGMSMRQRYDAYNSMRE